MHTRIKETIQQAIADVGADIKAFTIKTTDTVGDVTEQALSESREAAGTLEEVAAEITSASIGAAIGSAGGLIGTVLGIIIGVLCGLVAEAICGNGEAEVYEAFLKGGEKAYDVRTDLDNKIDAAFDTAEDARDAFRDFYQEMADESVDGFLFIGMHDNIKDPEAAYKEMYRILKPGGRILIAFPGSGAKCGGELVKMDEWRKFIPMFIVDEVKYVYAPENQERYTDDRNTSILVIARKPRENNQT